jgi:hypothetical protein
MQTMINCSARRPNIKMQRTGTQACLLDAQSNFPPLILSVIRIQHTVERWPPLVPGGSTMVE